VHRYEPAPDPEPSVVEPYSMPLDKEIAELP
jgi:hypothetical protein